MVSNYIKYKLGQVVSERSNKVSFVRYQEGHKNTRGESAPWVILSHKDGKVLSSHKTKEDAKKHLKDMHIFASLLPRSREIEIIVWVRQQKNRDQKELVEFVCSRFSMNPSEAERLVMEAVPDVISEKEESVLLVLDESCEKYAMYKELINDIFDIQLNNAPLYKLEDYEAKMNSDTPSTINNVCYYLLKHRNLV